MESTDGITRPFLTYYLNVAPVRVPSRLADLHAIYTRLLAVSAMSSLALCAEISRTNVL